MAVIDSIFPPDSNNVSDYVTVTEATFGTTTKAPSDDNHVNELAWLIPLVVAAIAVLLVLAVGFFYCIVKTELAIIKRCPKCCGSNEEKDEYVPLSENLNRHVYNDRYSLNG